MSTRNEAIFRDLTKHGVPLTLSVQLLARLESVEIKDIAERANCARSLVYMALSGDRSAPDRLRQTFRSAIGIDPWEELS